MMLRWKDCLPCFEKAFLPTSIERTWHFSIGLKVSNPSSLPQEIMLQANGSLPKARK